MKYNAGTGALIINEMVDSSNLIGQWPEIHKVLERDGYLLLRNFLDRQKVLEARKSIVTFCEQLIDTTKGDIMEAYAKDPQQGIGLLNYQYITKTPEIKTVLENERIFNFCENFYNRPAKTLQYKWLRGLPQGAYTGVHHDRVYLGRGSQNMITFWIPIGDIPKEQGTLAICKSSHNDPGFNDLRTKYTYCYNNLSNNGWFCEDPSDLEKEYKGSEPLCWVSTDFSAGDVCVIGLDVLHMSTNNTTTKYRISCDTRWQPKGERIEPMIKQFRHGFQWNDSD